MKEELKQILKMVEEGKITAEQAIQLMEAGKISEEEGPAEGRALNGKGKWLKIRVYDTATNKRKANVSVPLAIVNVGLKLGVRFGLDRDELKGFNFDEIINMIQAGEEGKIVDVLDEEKGEKVEIYLE